MTHQTVDSCPARVLSPVRPAPLLIRPDSLTAHDPCLSPAVTCCGAPSASILPPHLRQNRPVTVRLHRVRISTPPSVAMLDSFCAGCYPNVVAGLSHSVVIAVEQAVGAGVSGMPRGDSLWRSVEFSWLDNRSDRLRRPSNLNASMSAPRGSSRDRDAR